MKKYVCLFAAAFFLLVSGCTWIFYDTFQKFDDEFKNERKILARVSLKPEERRTEIMSAKVIFERVLSGNRDNVNAYFVIARESSSFKIDNSAFLKADNQTFELQIDNPVSELKSETETSVSSYASSDSTGVKTGQTTDIDSRTWFDDKFMFAVTPEMVTRISNAKEMIVRFYFGPVPATYIFRGSKLRYIQRILKEPIKE
jgi:hypothetical protein